MCSRRFSTNRLLLCLLTAAHLLLTACLVPANDVYPADPPPPPDTIYLTAHGWHVGIVVEAKRVRPFLPPSTHYPAGRWLEFGWGDASYYPNPDPGVFTLLKAAFLPTPTVMHLVSFDQPVEQRFPHSHTISLPLPGAGMMALGEFLADHLQTDEQGQAIYRQAGLYGHSAFFAARGIYILPHTSNMWTARALRAAGLPIKPMYTVTQSGLIRQAESVRSQSLEDNP